MHASRWVDTIPQHVLIGVVAHRARAQVVTRPARLRNVAARSSQVGAIGGQHRVGVKNSNIGTGQLAFQRVHGRCQTVVKTNGQSMRTGLIGATILDRLSGIGQVWQQWDEKLACTSTVKLKHLTSQVGDGCDGCLIGGRRKEVIATTPHHIQGTGIRRFTSSRQARCEAIDLAFDARRCDGIQWRDAAGQTGCRTAIGVIHQGQAQAGSHHFNSHGAIAETTIEIRRSGQGHAKAALHQRIGIAVVRQAVAKHHQLAVRMGRHRNGHRHHSRRGQHGRTHHRNGKGQGHQEPPIFCL